MTAAEQLLEDLLEVRVDLLKARREQLLHLAAQLGDHLRQLGLRLFDVGDLRLHEVIALPDLFIFVNRADVDVAQGADLAADLGHAAAQLGQALKRHTLAAGLALGQLVFFPQLAVGVVQLCLGGGAALGQAGHLAAHPLALVGQGAVVLPQLRDRSLLFEAGRVGRSNRFLRGGNFLLVVAAHALHLGDFQRVGLDFCLGGLNRRLQLAGAGIGLAGTAPQALQRGLMQADVLLVRQALQLLFGQLTGDFFAFCRQAARALAQGGQLGGVLRQLGLGVGPGLLGLGARGLVPGHGGLLGGYLGLDAPGRLVVLGGGLRQTLELEVRADVLRRGVHALALGTGQLGREVVHLGLAGGQFLFRLGAFLLKLRQLAAQLVQLLLAAEHADAAGGGAAGERAARVDDLAVQRDDAVPVAEVPRHGGRLGQVLDHDDAAQQIVDDILIFRVCPDQVGGDLRRAGQAAREAGALHGVQRQKRSAACALVLQKADGGAGTALVLDDDVLQRKAERCLNGGLVALFDGDDARHGADDAPQPPAARRAHDGLDALLVAVHVALQIFQNVDALGGGGPFSVRLLQVVGSLGLLTAAAVQFQLQARLDVVVAGHGLLGVLKAALGAAAFLVGSGGAGFQFLGLALCLGQAVGRSLPCRLRRRGADPGGGGGVLQAGHGGVNDVAALAAGSGLFLKGTQGLAQLGHAGVQPGHAAFQRLDGGAVVRGLALDALAALPGALQFGRSIVDAEPAVLALIFQDGDLALAAGVCLGDGADVGVGLLDGQHQLLGLGTQGRAFFVKLVQLAAQAVIVGLGGLVLALLIAQRVVGAADGIDPECDLQRLALLAQFQKLLCLLAVAFQGADALFQLTQNVPQAL